jgi:hypothetical protein
LDVDVGRRVTSQNVIVDGVVVVDVVGDGDVIEES